MFVYEETTGIVKRIDTSGQLRREADLFAPQDLSIVWKQGWLRIPVDCSFGYLYISARGVNRPKCATNRGLILARVDIICKCSSWCCLLLDAQSAGCDLLRVMTGHLPCLGSNCIVVDTNLRFPYFSCYVTQFIGR